MNQTEQLRELDRCFQDGTGPSYFIGNYVKIQDPILGEWILFDLWDDQETVLDTIVNNYLVILLKARQLGLTWLVLAYVLWVMKFRPEATVLLFSRRDTEAIHLLDDRLKGMYEHLPDWLKVGQRVVEDSAHEWQLSNGSVARAFPTSAGDSYAATMAVVDEADLVTDLNRLMRAVKPTIDAGGQMVLLSRSDKRKPASTFKAIYRGAKKGENDWMHVFLPWHARPDRDEEWYRAQERDVLARTGALDDLHEQYPATDTEALAPATLDKRIPAQWLENCYDEREPLSDEEMIAAKAPAIPGLRIFKLPEKGLRYVIGADPAEGNPTSDDSALTVLNRDTQEEVAAFAEKVQPSTLAAYADEIGEFYNRAAILVERNNHGHAVLLWLDLYSTLEVLDGLDGKPGWMSSAKGNTIRYTIAADNFRDRTTTIHNFDSYLQLASIDGSTLKAPPGERDDLADSYSIALVASAMVETVRVVDDSFGVQIAY